jgi:hypothetical protein
MSYSIDVQKGVPLDPWVEMLKKRESKEEPRAIYISERLNALISYDLLSKSELTTNLSKPGVYHSLESLPDWRYRRLRQGYIVYYKMPYEEITRTNEKMIKWMRENLQTPAHLKAVKKNIVNNLKKNRSLHDALKADLVHYDTILNSQLRMHASAVKNRCCIIRIICYIQDFFAKLWSGTLSGFFRYTVFLPMIDVDVWNSRYSIETFRRARKDFANAIIGQFEEELTSLIGKGVTVKQWMTDNHPDRNPLNSEKYIQVDELRQLIEAMEKCIASMGDPSVVQQPASQEVVVPSTEEADPQEPVTPLAADTDPQEAAAPLAEDTAPKEEGVTPLDAASQEVTAPARYNLTNVVLCPTDMPD